MSEWGGTEFTINHKLDVSKSKHRSPPSIKKYLEGALRSSHCISSDVMTTVSGKRGGTRQKIKMATLFASTCSMYVCMYIEKAFLPIGGLAEEKLIDFFGHEGSTSHFSNHFWRCQHCFLATFFAPMPVLWTCCRQKSQHRYPPDGWL